MRDRTARRWVTSLTAAAVTALAFDCVRSMNIAAQSITSDSLFIAMVALPALMVIVSVGQSRFALSWAVYWTWSFIFLGLAPGYQVAAGNFPWGGVFSAPLLAHGVKVVLLGHLVVLIVSVRRRRGPDIERSLRAATPSRALGKYFWIAIAAQAASGLLFAAAMGPHAMVSGKTTFQARLLEVAQLPAGGTLYFVATGLACIVPAAAIVIRRAGAEISQLSVWAATIVAAVVTNPLIGSRFLTGSFLVATVGALLAGRTAIRLVPGGAVLVFAFLFPSLDLWRGDNSGSSRVALASPGVSLQSFDYDAFEMLVRGVDVRRFYPDILDPARSLVGSVVHWIPFLTDLVPSQANSSLVAGATGMHYRNVSMPLVGEGYLLAGWIGVILTMGALGLLLRSIMARLDSASIVTAFLMDASVAALLFIVLRGSIYSALGYLLLALVVGGGAVAVDHRRSNHDLASPSTRGDACADA